MRKIISLLVQGFLLVGLVSTALGGLYRWVDEEGNVHYTDSVPPSQVQSGHTEFGKSGVQVKTIPRAKTPEEAQKERELERLRQQQEALLKKQQAADSVLLRTFRSEDDIKMARDGKIAAVDVMIEVTKSNIRRQQLALVQLRSSAANLERTGKPIPEHLSQRIDQTERVIRDAYATIIQREKQKSSIVAKFDEDITRFRQLKDLPVPESEAEEKETRPILHNIVPCSSAEECDRLWKRAATYVRKHATTAVQTSTPYIFITAPPTTDEDVSLILSRINDPKGPGASLFLDVQCERSLHGKEVCEGDRVQGILKEFRQAIVEQDGP